MSQLLVHHVVASIMRYERTEMNVHPPLLVAMISWYKSFGNNAWYVFLLCEVEQSWEHLQECTRSKGSKSCWIKLLHECVSRASAHGEWSKCASVLVQFNKQLKSYFITMFCWDECAKHEH